MKRSRIFALVLAACILQVSVVNYFKVFGIKPDLILISVVLAGLFCDLKFALAFSIFAGAFKDIYGLGGFGINTILLPLWSILAAYSARRISIDINLTRALLVFVAASLNAIIMTVFLWYTGEPVSFGIFMRIIFLDSLYTALVSLVAFKALKIK
ncbi:MAG: rod shape-determining protein MreD [Candidatus Omnitrophica bacterium]|nr:rod shape-determining protein MreD [Candidatus Omnitrophota bacterium]